MKKRSYLGLWILVVVYILSIISIFFFKVKNTDLITHIVCLITVLWVALITLVIYLTDSIHWYSGITKDDIKNATNEERKYYEKRIALRFIIFAILYTIYSIFAFIYNFKFTVSLVTSTVGLIFLAISTIQVKIKNEEE